MNCPACESPMNNLASPSRPAWWSCACGLSGTSDQLTARRRVAIRAQVDEPVDHKGLELVRKVGLPSAYQRFETIICPQCTCAGHIRETVAPEPPHTGHYQCQECGWNGPGKALRPDRTQDQVDSETSVDSWGTKVDKQVADSLGEDRRRGKKGGGGGSKSGGKKDRKQGRKSTQFRPDREEVVWANLRATNPLNKVVKVPGLTRSADDLRDASARFFEMKRASAGA